MLDLADPALYTSMYEVLKYQDVDQASIEHALRNSQGHANPSHVLAVAQRPAATGLLFVYTAVLEEVMTQQQRYGAAATMPIMKDEDLEHMLYKGYVSKTGIETMRLRNPALYSSAKLLRDYFASDTIIGSALCYGMLLEFMKTAPPISTGHH
jgi:hypothetical protein